MIDDAVAILVQSLIWEPSFAVLSITAFDYKDTLDFAPISIVLLSYVGLASRHHKRPYPVRWINFAHLLVYLCAVLPPLLFACALHYAAWRAQNTLGHWPIEIVDDPKNIARDNALFQQARHIVTYTAGFSGALILSWPALLLHLRSHLNLRKVIGLAGLVLLSWIAFTLSAGNLFSWWLD